jgi:hypothetical protein
MSVETEDFTLSLLKTPVLLGDGEKQAQSVENAQQSLNYRETFIAAAISASSFA